MHYIVPPKANSNQNIHESKIHQLLTLTLIEKNCWLNPAECNIACPTISLSSIACREKETIRKHEKNNNTKPPLDEIGIILIVTISFKASFDPGFTQFTANFCCFCKQKSIITTTFQTCLGNQTFNFGACTHQLLHS